MLVLVAGLVQLQDAPVDQLADQHAHDPQREPQQRGDLGDRLEVVAAQLGDRALLGAERHLPGGGGGGAQQGLELEGGPEVPGPAAGEGVRTDKARLRPLRLVAPRLGHRGNTAWSSARSCGVSTSPTLVTSIAISTTVWLTVPASNRRAAPSVRLSRPEAMAASWSARSRSRRSDTATSRPSVETTAACATPAVLRTKLSTSQFRLWASLLSSMVMTVPRSRRVGRWARRWTSRCRCGATGRSHRPCAGRARGRPNSSTASTGSGPACGHDLRSGAEAAPRTGCPGRGPWWRAARALAGSPGPAPLAAGPAGRAAVAAPPERAAAARAHAAAQGWKAPAAGLGGAAARRRRHSRRCRTSPSGPARRWAGGRPVPRPGQPPRRAPGAAPVAPSPAAEPPASACRPPPPRRRRLRPRKPLRRGAARPARPAPAARRSSAPKRP